MNGPAKNRLHDYEAGWLTLLLKMGVASEKAPQEAQNRVAQRAIDDMNERRERRRSCLVTALEGRRLFDLPPVSILCAAWLRPAALIDGSLWPLEGASGKIQGCPCSAHNCRRAYGHRRGRGFLLTAIRTGVGSDPSIGRPSRVVPHRPP